MGSKRCVMTTLLISVMMRFARNQLEMAGVQARDNVCIVNTGIVVFHFVIVHLF